MIFVKSFNDFFWFPLFKARPLEGKPRGGSQAMSEVPSKAPSMVAPRPQVPLGNDGKPWEFEGRFTPPPPWSGEKPSWISSWKGGVDGGPIAPLFFWG